MLSSQCSSMLALRSPEILEEVAQSRFFSQAKPRPLEIAAKASDPPPQQIKRPSKPPRCPRKAVLFGHHLFSRGIMAPLVSKDDYEIVFLDHEPRIVEMINNSESYSVEEFSDCGRHHETRIVKNYVAHRIDGLPTAAIVEIAAANVVMYSTIARHNFDLYSRLIARGIHLRDRVSNPRPLVVISCEQRNPIARQIETRVLGLLRDARLGDIHDRVRFTNSVIDRRLLSEQSNMRAVLRVERHLEWKIDTSLLGEHRPYLSLADFVGPMHFDFYNRRGIHVLDAGEAMAAYIAHHKNLACTREVVAIPDIEQAIRAALQQASDFLALTQPHDQQAQARYIDSTLSRLKNPKIKHSPWLVGSHPIGKMELFFLTPCINLAIGGRPYNALLRGFALALRFQNVEGDVQSRALRRGLGRLTTVEAFWAMLKVTHVDMPPGLRENVLKIMERAKDEIVLGRVSQVPRDGRTSDRISGGRLKCVSEEGRASGAAERARSANMGGQRARIGRGSRAPSQVDMSAGRAAAARQDAAASLLRRDGTGSGGRSPASSTAGGSRATR